MPIVCLLWTSKMYPSLLKEAFHLTKLRKTARLVHPYREVYILYWQSNGWILHAEYDKMHRNTLKHLKKCVTCNKNTFTG